MNPPLKWYLRLVFDIRSISDTIAVPKIAAHYIREEIARVLIDRTSIGAAVLAEYNRRRHLQRARDLGAAVYCVYHACDTRDCVDAEEHN